MLKAIPTENSIQTFLDKYDNNVYDIKEDRVLLYCIFPEHEDNHRSAVLYKSSGLYCCPVCGVYHIKQLIHGYASRLVFRVNKTSDYEEIVFNEPLDYRYLDNKRTLHWVNKTKEGRQLGNAYRIDNNLGKHGRMYKTLGAPGFRLYAPIITESTTDAVFLLEHGIDAGSFCGVGNYKLLDILEPKIYIPQYDDAGLKCAEKLSYGNTIFNFVNYISQKGIKDIREVSEENMQIIKELLCKYDLRI